MRIKRPILLGTLLLLLVGPFLVPVSTSGNLNKEEAAAALWEGRSQFVELAGHEVHYVTAGDPNSKRLIVLLHGFGASAFSYKDVLDPLSELGYVIAYDRAAFGFTERPKSWKTNPYGIQGQLLVLDQLIAKFGREKDVFVLGHSAGGNIAAAYAADNQEKLAGVILFAPAVLTTGGAPSFLNFIFDIPQFNHLGPLLVSSIATGGLDILYESYFNQDLITDEVLSGYRAPLKVAGWEKAFWEFNKAPRNSGVGMRLEEIQIPTLVITGDTDTIVPTSDSVTVAQRIKNSKLVEILETGHLPNEEKPAEFANAVSEFIVEVGNR